VSFGLWAFWSLGLCFGFALLLLCFRFAFAKWTPTLRRILRKYYYVRIISCYYALLRIVLLRITPWRRATTRRATVLQAVLVKEAQEAKEAKQAKEAN